MKAVLATIVAYLVAGLVVCAATPIRTHILKAFKNSFSPTPSFREIVFFWLLLYPLCVLFWPLVVFVKIQAKESAAPQDALMQNPLFSQMKEIHDLMAEMCEDGCDTDELPNACGEFGYDASNPIPTKTVDGSIVYLSSLRAPDGTKVRYKRQGSQHDDVSPHPIDIYDITHANGTTLATLYLSPYQKKISECAPRNFCLAK